MKTIILWFSALWLTLPVLGQEQGHYDLASVNESIQGDDYTVSILSWERQKVEINIDKPAGTPIEVRVRAADRQLLCSEKAARYDRMWRRVLNLTQLESGRYWLEIQVGRETIRRELWLETIEPTPAYRTLTLH